MPLLKRKPVPLLGLSIEAGNGTAKLEDEVFYLQATGEIFPDFESYSNRISFYLQKIFTCEATGKTGMDYYTALNSERRESEALHARFPEALKSRVLRSIQFQVIGRLDTLIDIIFERYRSRFFYAERCLADVGGEKYLCQITAVFPPQVVRDRFPSNGTSSSGNANIRRHSANDPTFALEDEDLFAQRDLSNDLNNQIAHYFATDLYTPSEVLPLIDPAQDYKYTVQLIAEHSKFEGSFMEVTSKSLSRDRFSFSKSIFKRFLKECVTRNSLVGSPWLVKPRLAQQYGLPLQQPEDVAARNKDLRNGALAKRKKTGLDDFPLPKRQRSGPGTFAEFDIVEPEVSKPKRAVKYPIEDLHLDPMSIFDGRLLRRTSGDIPDLPRKPPLSRELPVALELFDVFLHTWSTLNIFGWPLFLANFTLDDFASALQHNQADVFCNLVAEIHGVVLTLVINENSRVPGTRAATASGDVPKFHEPSLYPPGEEPMNTAQKERFVRKGLEHSRKWDRSKRLNHAEGRVGWERYLIGCLCQRGAIETMPELPSILRHLFQHDADALMAEPPATGVSELTEIAPESEISSEHEDENSGPAQQYPSLLISQKLAILSFLCDFVINSNSIRKYIDDCEEALTVLRKDRIEVNRDRRTFLAEKAELEEATKKTLTSAVLDNEVNTPKRNGTPAMETNEVEPAGDVDSDFDELASTNGSVKDSSTADISVTSAAGSRQAALREKALQRQAEASAKAKTSKSRTKTIKKQESEAQNPIPDHKRIEDGLLSVQQRDEVTEREFRRHQQVMRVRPLGKDRFFNRYWYFDGIGTMELLDEEENHVYGTGCLFVQGPSEQDRMLACELIGTDGEEGLKARRLREEGAEEILLATQDWAYLQTEEEFEQLNAWLNVKGNREAALRTALKEWRPYILGGAKRRLEALATPLEQSEDEPGEPAPTGRKTRKSNPNDAARLAKSKLPPYLRWENHFAPANVSKK